MRQQSIILSDCSSQKSSSSLIVLQEIIFSLLLLWIYWIFTEMLIFSINLLIELLWYWPMYSNYMHSYLLRLFSFTYIFLSIFLFVRIHSGCTVPSQFVNIHLNVLDVPGIHFKESRFLDEWKSDELEILSTVFIVVLSFICLVLWFLFHHFHQTLKLFIHSNFVTITKFKSQLLNFTHVSFLISVVKISNTCFEFD